jgi:hypothetical protein
MIDNLKNAEFRIHMKTMFIDSSTGNVGSEKYIHIQDFRWKIKQKAKKVYGEFSHKK